ncbi:hypothetical protein SAMN06298210_10393 [Prevotellaceae bacterium KH2P17]|nr:hypothetical protein SAMN06298210_10393 [Prevotellaceae bacterium KH2P17]
MLLRFFLGRRLCLSANSVAVVCQENMLKNSATIPLEIANGATAFGLF